MQKRIGERNDVHPITLDSTRNRDSNVGTRRAEADKLPLSPCHPQWLPYHLSVVISRRRILVINMRACMKPLNIREFLYITLPINYNAVVAFVLHFRNASSYDLGGN